MNYTDEELVLMNSITGMDYLNTIKFTIPGIFNKEDYIESGLRRLHKKNILSEENQLTDIGIDSVYIMEKFKTAHTKIVINNMHISLLDHSENAVCLFQNEDNTYELLAVNCIQILAKVLYDCEYLRRKTDDTIIISKEWKEDEWINNIYNFAQQVLHIRYFEDNRIMYDKVFYWDHKNGFEYDRTLHKEQNTTPQNIRVFLLQLLKIGEKNNVL